MSLNISHVADCVVRPALEALHLHSPQAVILVLGTGMVESRLTFLKQLGSGPALGIFQMEPATHKDIHQNVLRYNGELRNRLEILTISACAAEMAGNMLYAAAMCRIQYYRFSEPLPSIEARAMAEYHKKYYNTVAGATKVSESTQIFQNIIDGGYV